MIIEQILRQPCLNVRMITIADEDFISTLKIMFTSDQTITTNENLIKYGKQTISYAYSAKLHSKSMKMQPIL